MTHTEELTAEHAAADCPACFSEMNSPGEFWQARPVGSRLVGLVVHREGMPSVVAQRNVLAGFGVTIENFRHPAPDTLETWEQRLDRLFSRLMRGDVLVVTDVKALGRDATEEARTVNALTSRGVVVKVVGHGRAHLASA